MPVMMLDFLNVNIDLLDFNLQQSKVGMGKGGGYTKFWQITAGPLLGLPELAGIQIQGQWYCVHFVNSCYTGH